MNLKDIQNLIKFVAKSGANEVKLEMDDVKITIKTGLDEAKTTIVQQTAAPIPQQIQPQIAPTPQALAPQPAVSKEKESGDENAKYLTIKSPIIGTFYRRPSPNKPLFVEVGSNINVGDTVCIIEAMKLFNEIESEISGKIVKVLVEDATPVEFEQPLFLVDPS
ncbi:MAG: acetyl-CoA carboxylase, biotin carboxyl carrier protein [Flavobacteriales bacterium]|nr:MAG: acetyl-CoA carboxylase, biotin carboxyl carrier protein [Flavobacteriales bacterium]